MCRVCMYVYVRGRESYLDLRSVWRGGDGRIEIDGG